MATTAGKLYWPFTLSVPQGTYQRVFLKWFYTTLSASLTTNGFAFIQVNIYVPLIMRMLYKIIYENKFSIPFVPMEHPSTYVQDKLRASSLPAEALCKGWEGYEHQLSVRFPRIGLRPPSGRTGMLFFLFMIFFSPLYSADISLKLTSMDQAPLKEAGAGQPFLLHVIINNASNTAQYPTIQGIDNLHVRQNGFQMNMVNGTTSVTYQYRIRIDTPGTYTLGPAQFNEPQGTVESQPITVTVAQEQKTSEVKKQATNKSQPSFLRLTCDKEKVVEGEKINCTLTFYTPDQGVSIQALNEPEQTDPQLFTIKAKQGPITGNQMINGVEHRFAQWKWQLYPNRPGSYTIPAYAADYIVQTSNNMFSVFFGRNETKRTYSNTLRITVDPLPSHKESISYIGAINDFSAKINPSTAKIGEGIVLTLILTGNGDAEKLTFVPLHNMPDGLKWYESKHFTEPSNTDPTITSHGMEYVVQGLQPGDYEIPAQSIHYFDTTDRVYKTRKTVPLSLRIHASPTTNSNQSHPDDTKTTNILPDVDDIRPLNQEGPWHAQMPRIIPWHLYWILISLLGLISALITLMHFKPNVLETIIKPLRRNNSCYALARAKIKLAHQTKHYASFYTIFTNLLAKHMNMEPSAITSENIHDMFIQAGLSRTAFNDWQNFFSHIAELSFYHPHYDEAFYNQLTQNALYWIDVLEKLPRGER